MDYKIKLDIFEGPLDLLLHLINENQIDVYDIPIALITEQYLQYISLMKTLNLDMAGEFILMASELTRIKSIMLLPKKIEDKANENNGSDPREGLVQKLLEYKKYKDTVAFFRERERFKENIFINRGRHLLDNNNNNKLPEQRIELSLFDLLKAFNNILNSISANREYTVVINEVSITEKMSYLLECLEEKELIEFENILIKGITQKIEVIALFLAILELVRIKAIIIYQSMPFGSIKIRKYSLDNKKISNI